MSREVEVICKCDFCFLKFPENELFWNSKEITIEGITYLVDACERDATTSERHLVQWVSLIQEHSRKSEKQPKPRKSTSGKGRSADKTDRPGPHVCSACGKDDFKSYRARRIHESKEHGIKRVDIPKNVPNAELVAAL